VSHKQLAFLALQLAALVAVFVWLGGGGRFAGLLVASVAARWFLWRA